MRSHHFRRLIFSGCFCLCWPFGVAPRMFREALHMIFSKSFIDPRESFACAIRHQPSPSTVPETATRPPELQTPSILSSVFSQRRVCLCEETEETDYSKSTRLLLGECGLFPNCPSLHMVVKNYKSQPSKNKDPIGVRPRHLFMAKMNKTRLCGIFSVKWGAPTQVRALHLLSYGGSL
jgi:hypothetical protein